MKRIYNMSICFLILIEPLNSQTNGIPINPLIMGQAYHYTDWHDPKNTPINIFGAADEYTDSPSPAAWPKISESKVTLVRVGGNQYNMGSERPIGGQEVYYVSIVDDIRKNGCEPVLTIPFTLTANITSTNMPEPGPSSTVFPLAVQNSINTATTILNLVNTIHKRNIKYIILGNEPDIDYKWTTNQYLFSPPCASCTTSSLTIAQNIAGYIKPIAKAIKDLYPDIKIIGPEYAEFDTKVLSLLTSTNYTNPECITGTISSPGTLSNGLPYIDYMSYHCYYQKYASTPDISPGTYSSSSDWQHWMAYTDLEKYAKDWNESAYAPLAHKRYRGALRWIRQQCEQISKPVNNGGRGYPLGFMITEMNSNFKNTAQTPNPDPSGMDSRSLLSAQVLARMYALGMEYGAAGLMMWSVKEGSGNYWNEDRGYLDNSSGLRRPTWYHFKMMADYFKGTYYRDEVLASAIGNDATSEPNHTWLHYSTSGSLSTASAFIASETATFETKAFAARSTSIAVMVLNHSGSNQSISLRFGSGTVTGSANKKFRFDMSVPNTVQHNFTVTGTASTSVVGPNSTNVFIFNCDGTTLIQRYTYGTLEAQSYTNTFTASVPNVTPIPVGITTQTTGNNCINQHTCTLIVNNAPGGSSYNWQKLPQSTNLGTGSSISTMTMGIYQTTVSASGGCSVVIATPVHQNSPLVNAGKGGDMCVPPHSITLGNSELPINIQTYSWAPFGGTLSTAAITSLSVSTMFTLTATQNGCTLSDNAHVSANTGSVDLYIGDFLNDPGLNSNPAGFGSGTVNPWSSPYIWVDLAGQTGTIHTNPPSTSSVYVNVMVQNKGCQAVNPGQASVTVYHSKTHTAASWNTHWINYSCMNMQNTCSPAPNYNCGDLIVPGTNSTAVNSTTILPNSYEIIEIPWYTPNNQTCLTVNNSSPGHWCLLAHLSAPSDPLPSLNVWPVYQSATSNNIALKNMEIVVSARPGKYHPQNEALIRNDTEDSFTKLEFDIKPDLNGETLLEYATLTLYFSSQLITSWVDGGEEGDGIILLSDTSVQVISPFAHMDNIFMHPGQIERMSVIVESFLTPNLTGGTHFVFDVSQFNPLDLSSPRGGVDFYVEKEDWHCEVCEDQIQRMQSVSYTPPISNDTLLIQGVLDVNNGVTFDIQNSFLKFSENSKIKVHQGGQLIINNSILQAACPQQKWNGIEVEGSPLATNCLTITNCKFLDTETPIEIKKGENIVISNNAFIGPTEGVGQAIKLDKSGKFKITENNIAKFSNGIVTARTFTSTLNQNLIEKNVLQKVNICINMQKDNHLQTQIRCNKFGYSDYAMRSDSCSLANFGSTLGGAGNTFHSQSTLGNNKLNHTSGNTPTYYYNSAQSFTSGMNINTQSSLVNHVCYSYSFDTSSVSARELILDMIEDEKLSHPYLSIVPNPNSGHATLKFNLGGTSEGKILVRDIHGRKIVEFTASEGATQQHLDLSQNAKGVYFASLQLTTGELLYCKVLLQE